MMRCCSKCKKELPIECFGIHKQRKDGISLWCKECNRNCVNKYRSTDVGRENHRLQELERHHKNPGPVRARAKKWRSENLERAKKSNSECRRRRMDNPELRKKEYARIAQWEKDNKARVAARRRSNKLLRMNAQPKWLSPIQKAQMQEFYEIALARQIQTGEKHHVDHIFAIKGKSFNGLHVPWNLQVMTRTENDKKFTKVPKEFEHMLWNEQRHVRSGA
jgi:hypothetical protein